VFGPTSVLLRSIQVLLYEIHIKYFCETYGNFLNSLLEPGPKNAAEQIKCIDWPGSSSSGMVWGGGGAWTGLIWLRIGTSDRHL